MRPTKLSTSRLSDGSLRVKSRLLKDHWLYYVDSGDGTTTDRWTLRVKNTITLVEKVISKGNGGLSGFSVDGDTIALNFTDQYYI
jgi:hypothetical protein